MHLKILYLFQTGLLMKNSGNVACLYSKHVGRIANLARVVFNLLRFEKFLAEILFFCFYFDRNFVWNVQTKWSAFEAIIFNKVMNAKLWWNNFVSGRCPVKKRCLTNDRRGNLNAPAAAHHTYLVLGVYCPEICCRIVFRKCQLLWIQNCQEVTLRIAEKCRICRKTPKQTNRAFSEHRYLIAFNTFAVKNRLQW